ncbi:MAG: hypothetical protein ACKOBY_10710 [Cyanobium sp.]
MVVVNRCAVAVAARRPMLDWSRPFLTREDMEGLGDEQSLYLLPTWDDGPELEQRLQERWSAIFEAELELWCRDRQLWPSPRSYPMFLEWFELRFFPLVEALGGEQLRSVELEPGVEAAVGDALR